MKKLIRHLLTAIALWCGCSPQGPDIAGTSEQGNAKFIATLYTQTGAAAIGCKAILRRSDYITNPDTAGYKTPGDGVQLATDENGLLIIDSLDTGTYSVEVTDAKAHAALMKFGIGPMRKSVNWGPDTIRQFAVVQGWVAPLISHARRFAQVFGLERLVPVDSSGSFVLSDLPQGLYKIRVVAVDTAAGSTVFDSVAAKAGAATSIGLWKSRAPLLTATMYTPAGLPAAGFSVVLRRSDYASKALNNATIDSNKTTTNGSGFLSIDSLDTGAYSLEVTDTKAYAVLIKFYIGPARDSLRWGADTVRQFAVVKGKIDSVNSQDGRRFAQVDGLERFVPIASAGVFVLNDLPQGMYTIRVVTADPATELSVFDSVAIKAGDTTTIGPYWFWKSRASISFNTSGIQENVRGFPVLIRLNSNNFNFPAAQPNGADLRFAKADDAALPFEIERWDPAAKLAEVWVKIDTIFGNDSNQSIVMYWDNPAAHSRSASGSVFDTADGFQAVWHLGDSSDTLYDATNNRYHGIRHGSLKRSSCVIGNGQTFDSAEAYCEMGNVFNPGVASFTVSAWVKRANTGLQTIIAKSNGGTPSSTYGWSLSFGLADQLHCYIANNGSMWGAAGAFDFWSRQDVPVVDSITWHYVVAVVDRSNNKNCRTFIDGVDVTDTYNGNVSAVGSLANSLPLRIGAEADGEYQWTGSIDECVISRTARPEAWVRLCFINQGTHDGLVKFIRSEH
jgi:hypothetical protein